MAIEESEKQEVENLMKGRSPRKMYADADFLARSREDLRMQYPNQWVAVHDKKVVAAASGVQELLKRLRDQKIPKEEALIDFIPEDKPIMVV